MKHEGQKVLLVTGSSSSRDAQAVMAALATDHGDRVIMIDASATDAAEIAAEAMTGTVGAIMICDDVPYEVHKAIFGVGKSVMPSEPRDELLDLLRGPSMSRLVGKALAKSYVPPAPSRGDPLHNQAPRSYRGSRGRQRP